MTPEETWALLPAALRARDVEAGGVLRALVEVLAAEAGVVDADLDALADDWFIETCEEWLVPYLAELVGVRGVHPLPGTAFSNRARVADTLRYRRRKGTAAMLEDLARTTTGWTAAAVELFEVLATTQHLDHVRLAAPGTALVRDGDRMELVGGAFDTAPRTVDVRPMTQRDGWYNLPNVGLFVWPLGSYPLDRATAAPALGQPAGCWQLDPLAVDHHLAGPTVTETDVDHRAEENNVPGPLRRRPLRDELAALRAGALADDDRRWFRDDDPALVVWVQPTADEPLAPVALADLYACDLSDWAQPAGEVVRVDPVLGRVTLDPAEPVHRLAASWYYALGGDLGAGTYPRRGDGGPAEEAVDWQLGVSATDPLRPDEVVGTVADAVAAWHAWQAANPGTVGRIVLMDSHRYEEAFTGPNALHVGQGSRLSIVGARWPAPPEGARASTELDSSGVRPCVRGDVELVADGAGEQRAQLAFDGVLLDGSLTVTAPALSDAGCGLVELHHSTLVPSRGGLVVADGNPAVEVLLRRSICGPVRLPAQAGPLTVTESALQAVAGGAAVDAADADASLAGATVIGTVSVRSIAADDCVFTGRLTVARRQAGCVRFCYVPPGSATPRRYRCQPDLAVAAGGPAQTRRLVPAFASTDLSSAGYARLSTDAATELLGGAASGAEMGAFRFVLTPQRLTNLRAALEEYLPFGRSAAALPVVPIRGGQL